MGMSETKKQKKSCLDYTRVWMTIIAFGYLVLYRLFQLTIITDVNVFIGYVYFTAAVGVLLSIIDFLRLRCCPKVFKSKKILAILTLGLAIMIYCYNNQNLLKCRDTYSRTDSISTCSCTIHLQCSQSSS